MPSFGARYFERENLGGHERPLSSVSAKDYKIYTKLSYLI